jgi:hypothetical protein
MRPSAQCRSTAVNSDVRHKQQELNMSLKDTAIIAAKIYFHPIGYLVESVAESTIDSTKENSNKKSIEELRLSAKRQELQMQMAEAQAKVAQELAIAKRIEIAEEVEIEEFYDLNGGGSVGLKADEQGITAEASASGRRVSKRIYKFRGVNASFLTTDESA